MQENGDLEIHVPRPFTTQRPAVAYTHQALDMKIEDHTLANQLPKPTETASIHPGPPMFREFAVPENAPETVDDYVYSDTPQLALRITSFNNATIVALAWPHTLMDVMGQQALLHGWSLVLAGRESDVPPMLGAREDVMLAAIEAPVEKEEAYSLTQKRLKGWAMAKFGLRFASDLLINRVVETRTIFLPKETVVALQLQAQSDLAALQKDDTKPPFVSEGDVLTAWAIRAVATSLPQPRPIAALHALNARFRLTSLINSPGVHVQNMAVAAFAFVGPDVARGPLGPIALENRRHLVDQATEPQVLAYLRELAQVKADPSSMLFCDPDALLMPFTNWTRANLFETADFGDAVVRAGETGPARKNPPGTMVYHHAQSLRQSQGTRNVVVVLGKDLVGNYWIIGTLLPASWARIEEEIKSM
jgi:hypothetical protein